MSLTPGDKLGRYEILERIGAGGMGEVYRARDTDLGREVAIKTSTQRFSERFEREAKLISSLNHPNICTLHDVGPDYLVMELVDGPTLDERIKHGALPLDEALDIARQIGLALEEAHGKLVVHRDLKPGNIKIRPDGVVKVLDFGLAKAMVEARASSDETRTLGQTEAGMVLGTPAYMSPEQARGQKVDKRADIWSFGVLLYEMLTAKKIFQGETTVDILSQVVNKEPDFQIVPVKVRPLLKRCLEKDANKRLRDISGMELLLEESPLRATVNTSSLGWKFAAGALAIALAISLWAPWRPTQTGEQPLVRLDVDLGLDVPNTQIGANALISPDGGRLVYPSQGRLFTRRLDQPKAVELSGTEGANDPFFSPDGRWVAFFTRGKLQKVSVDGGASIALCDAPNSRGGSWGDDGNIIAALTTAGVLSRIPSTGGTATPLTSFDPARGEVTHRWPHILPGGKAVLFTAHTRTGQFDRANIDVVSLSDGRRKTLVQGGTYGRYLPTGHLVYVNSGTLFAVPFDLDRLEVHGAPTPLLEGIGYTAGSGRAEFDFSRNGTLVYREASAGGGQIVSVQWLESTGKIEPVLAKPGRYQRPRLSPDGSRLALAVTEGSSRDIWISDWKRGTMTRLTFGGESNTDPAWSPDGRFIVFDGQAGLFWTRSDGAGKPQALTQSRHVQNPFSFTPDGKHLAFHEPDAGTGYDLWTLPLEATTAGLHAGKPEVVLQTLFNEEDPSFSPDGRWLAYASNESGAQDVFVRAFPDTGGKWMVSNGGGEDPVWSKAAQELFFRNRDGQIMVTSYAVKGDSFAPEKPRLWSEKKLAYTGLNGMYDLAPDGKRIVGLFPVEDTGEQRSQSHITFLLNFFDEIRRRTAAGTNAGAAR